ncbi:MAG: hypothetical protein ACMUIE_01500 [Thermoplasmatota archaeon]
MTEGSTDNARDILLKAELALATGNFFKARRIAKNAGSMLEKTQKLHRKFIGRMKEFMEKLVDMEGKGYDVREAMGILENAKGKAMKSDYEKALNTIERMGPALERATYLPFPLLNKTVDIISTIMFTEGKISYTVRINNPTKDPLGEIIIKPTIPPDDFNDIGEQYIGIIPPEYWKEYTFFLVPKKKDWSIGVSGIVLSTEGVVLTTKLSSREGKAKYYVTLENNGDQILRDIPITPFTPGGLEADPTNGTIDFVEPFAQKTLEFDLAPAVLETRTAPRERYVVVEEEAAGEEMVLEEEEEEEEVWEDEAPFKPAEQAVDLEVFEDEDMDLGEGPRDFTPVREEYNLIEMSPLKFPEDIEKELKKTKK